MVMASGLSVAVPARRRHERTPAASEGGVSRKDMGVRTNKRPYACLTTVVSWR